jgi:hypothetical protein
VQAASNYSNPEIRSPQLYVLGQYAVVLSVGGLFVSLLFIVATGTESPFLSTATYPFIIFVYTIAVLTLILQYSMLGDMIWLIEGRNADILSASASASASAPASEPTTDETEKSINPNPVDNSTIYHTPK